MALRPIRPGEEGRPNTPEEQRQHELELKHARENPADWGNDPILKQVNAEAVKQAAGALQRTANDSKR